MKITAQTKYYQGTDKMYNIQVWDDDALIDEQWVETVIARDKVIWDFADYYNTTNIEVEEPSPKKKTKKSTKKESPAIFRFSEIPSIPVLTVEDAQDYFDDNEEEVYTRIINAIKEGIDADVDEINLFELAGTGVYMTSARVDWIEGLENAKSYFEKPAVEEYELCAHCRDLLEKLYSATKPWPVQKK